MGIRGLRHALSRYGTPGSLSGENVVIDGPSLVHRILEGCIFKRQPPDSFACHPSYATLGRLLISWLDELGRNDVRVRKIFFDGYLPPVKWDIRHDRLRTQSKLMKELVISFPAGSSKLPESIYNAIEKGSALPQSGFPYMAIVPKPPFLIPGVLEILRAHQEWGPLVEIVPGEADMYCAEYVRQHGGTILTTDSDLLVADLGENGTVSYLSDIIPAEHVPSPTSELSDIVPAGQSPTSVGLTALKFSSRAIEKSLQLDIPGGLGRVAFEMEKHGLKFNQATRPGKVMALTGSRKLRFQEFLEDYTFKTYLPKDHFIHGVLSTLDARVAEIVVQALTLDGSGAETRGPDSMSMFLPVVIEDRSKKSAWYMSTAVRELAYGVLQRYSSYQARTVFEYRLLDASDRLGRRVDVPGPKELDEQCASLASTLEQLASRLAAGHKKQMLWLAFAISQEILWSKLEQRSPLSISLINNTGARKTENNKDKTTAGKEGDIYDWDIIQFTARVQATFYSLRMAKQFLQVAAHLSSKDSTTQLPKSMLDLHNQLKHLPPIVEWPLVPNMSRALATAREARVLAAVMDVLGLSPSELLLPPSPPPPPPTEIKKKKGPEESPWPALRLASDQRKAEKKKKGWKSTATNRFSALGSA
ncbi:hypothetical protein F5Y17DRAFT_420809 [Xylariaceae sp. FL0594]|nr:hypothetical protein F5Y17DRAFT_420809 [Xylariaceae sp. FL0594]